MNPVVEILAAEANPGTGSGGEIFIYASTLKQQTTAGTDLFLLPLRRDPSDLRPEECQLDCC